MRGDGADVLYVHGATFPADLSVFFRFDGRSWADALNEAGYHVWGFDFAGYGGSDRYEETRDGPSGRIDVACMQLRRVVDAIREQNGGKPVILLAHSWGTTVAARFAGEYPQSVSRLVLFGPIVPRGTMSANPAVEAPAPALHTVSLWAQYRRFVSDVPADEAQVLSEAHMQSWGEAYLATDAESHTRMPPAVQIPYGPVADAMALWSGHELYDAARIKAPTLIVRGEWDSSSTDGDAAALMAALETTVKADVKIARATHLMHLESQRTALYAAVADFLAADVGGMIRRQPFLVR